MRQVITSSHFDDADGNPAGGTTTATGLTIAWQNGPLAVDGERREPNGCFVETVIAAAVDRLEYYQRGKFACRENALAVTSLAHALEWLRQRTAGREQRGVEGTHQS